MTRATRFITLLLAISLIALFTQNITAAQSNILVVTSKVGGTTSGGCDATDCSLLDAINQSDAMDGVQTIQFNISGTPPFIIYTNNTLRIRQSVIIDARTQPQYVDKPVIEIRPFNAPASSDGIYVENTTPFDPTLSVTIRGLAITGFIHGSGILLGNGQNHIIEKDFIGVTTSGSLAAPNYTGISMRSPDNIIQENVISGNYTVGILMVSNGGRNSTNNQIVGNFIGTNFGGTQPLPNQDGIQISEGANNNIIGGTTPADRNIISGNTRWGIFTDGNDNYPSTSAHNTTIQGNYIGTDVSGILDLGNGADGISLWRSDSNVIGGTTGTTPGGSCTGACNLISGNNTGIVLFADEAGSAEHNVVEGNFIGTTVTGQAALPNNFEGIIISSSSNTVGGTTPAARNLISGNTTHGIRLGGLAAFGNEITGNYIGTDTTGSSRLGNHGFGIFINGAAYGNQIGDGTDEGANWIGFNGVTNQAGIGIDEGLNNGFYADQNLITRNSIFDNAGLGIDLLPTGVTANDAGDNDTGANGLQNAPIITSVLTQTQTIVTATLDSAPNRDYTVEFFYSPACDETGSGEGKFYIGALSVKTDGSGHIEFDAIVDPPLAGGSAITATAIDNDETVNSPFYGNTSEFSNCKSAQTDLSITKTDSADPVLPGDSLAYTLTVSNAADASYADHVVVTDTLPVGLTYGSAIPSQGSCDPFDAPTRKVTCNLGQITSGAAATVTIATTVNLSITTSTISNTASVTSDTHDPVMSNNAATQPTAIAHSNLRVTITDTPDPVLVDGLLTYVVAVSNLGTDTATNVALTDTLPANVYLIGVSSTQGTCTPGSGVINCALGTLNNNAGASVTILMRPTIQNTTITNTATVSALQVDPVTANNTFIATTKVNPSSGIPSQNLFTISTPTLTWNAVSYATAYEIQVDDNAAFSSPNFHDANISPLIFSVTTTPLADGLWYWRVRAKNADGTWGSWSTTANFMIDTP